MADALRSAPESEASATTPLSTTGQLQHANRQLAVISQELATTHEQLRAAHAQLWAYDEQARTQATDLWRSEQAVQRLYAELALTNAGLLDTIIDSLQATEFARAEAEAQRQRLHRLLAEAPASIALLTGPNYVVELATTQFCALVGRRDLVGHPLGQAAPALVDQPFFGRLAAVYRTGEPYTGTDLPVRRAGVAVGPPAQRFASYILQATRDEAGRIDGLLIFAHEAAGQAGTPPAPAAGSQRLAHPNEVPDTLVYVALHDLQGPLDTVCGLLKALRAALPEANQPVLVIRLLDLLHNAAERFRHTLTQLGTIAPVQAEASQPRPL